MSPENLPILIADDDAADCELMKKALQENKVSNPCHFVSNGVELMEYLTHQGKYQDQASAPRPCIIFLDLNMPKKDGREALGEIKASAELKSIPVVIMTNSQSEEDIAKSYHLGVNSYVQKPVTFEGLVEVTKKITDYWFQIVKLPPRIS